MQVAKDRARYAFNASRDSLQDDHTLGLTRVPTLCQQAAVALVGTLVRHRTASVRGQRQPTPCLRPPARAPGQHLAPLSRPLVAGFPSPTHLQPLRGVRRVILCRASGHHTGARGALWWPRAPGLNYQQARAGARKRRCCSGASGTRKPPRIATRAQRVPPSCGSKCTRRTPNPSGTCGTCLRPDPRPTPRLAEPTAPCLSEGGTGRSTPEPAAEHRRQPSGAWLRTR